MNVLSFYVPDHFLEHVKNALFCIGAGEYRNYDQCCWQVKGEGQFRPLRGANPSIGRVGEVKRLVEWKVEILIQDQDIEESIKCLLREHPYEEVAYYVTSIKN